MRSLLPLFLILLAPMATAQSVCLRDTPWGQSVAPHSQRMEFELIERDGDVAIVGIRFSPLEGEFAKLYGFFLHNGDCVVRAVVVGAFASANGARPVESIDGGPVLYNTDFFADQDQLRIALSEDPPSYESARERALRLLR